jgi:replicative DNA helicase
MGRLLCSRGSVDGQRYRRGQLDARDWETLQRIGNEVRQAPFFVDDDPAQGIVRIASTTRRYKAQKKIRLAIVDYLQIIDPDTISHEAKARNQRWANRQEVVALFSRRLKQLARHEQIPVLALAQLNRQSQNRASRKPMLSDLRESGGIEADADLVVLLHTEDDDEIEKPAIQEVELLIRKQRNGPTGMVKLNFHRAFTRFEDLPHPECGEPEFRFSDNGHKEQ